MPSSSMLRQDQATPCIAIRRWAMYLRGPHYRTIITRNYKRVWSAHRPRFAPLARAHTELQHNQVYRAQQKASTDDKDGRKRSAIRPITLFAICIPLGYALNWILKQQNEANKEATPDGFVKYTLATKEDVSSNCSIFTLKPATSSPISIDDAALERAITSIQFKQPQLQIARNYTLLPPKKGQDSQELRFLIRRERNGEVSGYLHRLPIGAEIEIRGVFAEYNMPKDIDSVIFLAGGTGIAPAMQAAQMLAGETEIRILWASRKREDCVGGTSDGLKVAQAGRSVWNWWQRESVTNTPQAKGTIVTELDRLKQHGESQDAVAEQTKLLVNYFVDEEGNFIQASDVQQLLRREIMRPSNSKDTEKKLLFVSGPEGFINHWAAPKQWKNGHEVQGRIGGVLSTLDLNGWEIVKL